MEELFYIEKRIQEAILEKRKNFTGSDEEFDKILEDKLPVLFESIAKTISDEIFDHCIRENSERNRQEKKTKRKILNKYKTGIKLLEAFIELNANISSNSYNKYFKIFDTLDDHLKLDTLISIHARACQISNEIRILITNGYADGAHARWRSLHELSAIFLFLYDNDYELTRMYNEYEAIERWKKAKEYQESCQALGFEPLSDEEIKRIEKEKDFLENKYGKDFSKNYGWTIKILPEGRRNFREIEKKVGKDHMRVYYTWSSENVHSGVSAQKRRLGLRENEQTFFLTCSHDYGFLDPVQLMANSLSDMSIVFLDMEESLMNEIFKQLLIFFEEELLKGFGIQENDL